MSAVAPNRFSQLEVLQGIGRNLLTQLLAQCESKVLAAESKVQGPRSKVEGSASPYSSVQASALDFGLWTLDSSDEAFFSAVASLFSPSSLCSVPAPFLEALTILEDLCDPETKASILSSLSHVPLGLDTNCSIERTAVQILVALPDLPATVEHYDLNVFREQGPEALDVTGFPEITQARLTEVETVWENVHYEVTIKKADNIFESADCDGNESDAIPPGEMTRAVLRFDFADDPAPCFVTITPPYTLTMRPSCRVALVKRLLTQRGFRTLTHAKPEQMQIVAVA